MLLWLIPYILYAFSCFRINLTISWKCCFMLAETTIFACCNFFWSFKILFRPDGVGTVTLEEREKFDKVKARLRSLLEKEITNFRCTTCTTCVDFLIRKYSLRYCFPFGRPEGALKATLSLLERVIYFPQTTVFAFLSHFLWIRFSWKTSLLLCLLKRLGQS